MYLYIASSIEQEIPLQLISLYIFFTENYNKEDIKLIKVKGCGHD
jgi:hypothetical protein